MNEQTYEWTKKRRRCEDRKKQERNPRVHIITVHYPVTETKEFFSSLGLLFSTIFFFF